MKKYFTSKATMKITLWKDNQRQEAKPFGEWLRCSVRLDASVLSDVSATQRLGPRSSRDSSM